MTMIALWKHVDHIVCVLHKQYEQKRRRTFPIWAVLIPASCDCLIQIRGHSHQAQTRPQRGLDTTATNLSETGSKQIKQGERDCNKLNKRPSVTLVSCMCLESVAIIICVTVKWNHDSPGHMVNCVTHEKHTQTYQDQKWFQWSVTQDSTLQCSHIRQCT